MVGTRRRARSVPTVPGLRGQSDSKGRGSRRSGALSPTKSAPNLRGYDVKGWSHGHSMLGGLLIGLSLAAHAWLFIVGGIFVGFILRDVFAIRRRVIAYFNRNAERVVVNDWRRQW